MSGIVDTMKKIAAAEMSKLHIASLGVVTSVFPHSDDGDKDNYECNVKLKDKDLELRKVPVATSSIGFADIPQVGDLVLLSFINGEVNSPIIIGRLYNDEDRPPVSKPEEIVFKPPYSKNPDLRRIHLNLPEDKVIFTIQDEKVTLHIAKTDITISEEGVVVETESEIKITSKADLSIKAKNVTIEAESKTTIKGGESVDINP